MIPPPAKDAPAAVQELFLSIAGKSPHTPAKGLSC
jgi:hypothetical protein